MKRIILLLALFLTLVTANTQNLIITDTIYRDGIYRTFEEFKFNKPSIEFDYNVVIKTHNYSKFNIAQQVAFYKIMISKKIGKSIGNVFGFSNGNNVYINDHSPKLSPKIEFSKIEYFGIYCYYKEIYNQTVYTKTSRAEKNIKDSKNIHISNNVRNVKYRSTASNEGRLVEKNNKY